MQRQSNRFAADTENYMPTHYRDEFAREFPKIRTYGEDDLEWFNEGLALMEAGKLVPAEAKFKQLILSQPSHPDGVKGLARVYLKMGDGKKALFFINEAIAMTEQLVKIGDSDPEILEMMNELRSQIDRTQLPPHPRTRG